MVTDRAAFIHSSYPFFAAAFSQRLFAAKSETSAKYFAVKVVSFHMKLEDIKCITLSLHFQIVTSISKLPKSCQAL